MNGQWSLIDVVNRLPRVTFYTRVYVYAVAPFGFTDFVFTPLPVVTVYPHTRLPFAPRATRLHTGFYLVTFAHAL